MTARPAGYSEERDAALCLSLAEGVGPLRIQALVRDRGSALAALRSDRFRPETVARVGTAALVAVRRARGLDTRAYWALAAASGAGAVCPSDPEYPALLGESEGPPPVLWVRPWPRGLDALGDRVCAAVVGTRRATAYGRRMARAIGADLAAAGIVVVSGMAYGIDREAHEGALEAGGPTVAVTGCGVDRIYPRLHARLAERIMENGALVSEFPPGTPPAPGRFPRRNRVIAGITRATVVVESHERGGALITARFATDLGREVYCVPGPLDSPASRGVHGMFVDGGAHLVTEVGDVAAGLGARGPGKARIGPDLTPHERKVLDAVPVDPAPLHAIMDAAGMEVSVVLSSLLTLELKGLLRQLAGRHFCRTHPVPG